ncbi:DnaJ domain-containing protein [Aspergillus granulosus]|uniref:DnaJ domain-containing protein n=1 Tax=Aspergillus granulosus TaxID=176169 RepID=A0ABR4HBG0_9EURO
MPLYRRLRPSIPQLIFDRSHQLHATPVFHHINLASRSYTRHHRHGCGFSYTRKIPFSTTSQRFLASSREPTYYEILDVPVTATPSEIKKKFYSLSLRHHPDRNPNDPTASARFAKISSAYHVLSNAAKRSTYDRDNGIHSYTSTSTHSSANPGQHPMGSHSSHGHYQKGASYFGSRPASGLSKRRGPFRGPPPSFYAHGGYGNRKAPPTGDSAAGTGGGASSRSGAAGGAKYDEDDPTAFVDRNPIGHFNARGHYRTQTAEDTRRQERRSRQSGADINDQYIGNRGDFMVRFIAVTGILVGATALSGFIRWPQNIAEKSGKTTRPSRTKDA